MGADDGCFVFELAEQPARRGREFRARGVLAGADAVWLGAAQAGGLAGGEAGHGGGDDAGGAVEAVAEERGQGGELGVAAEAQRDEADELGDERAEAGREIRGQEAWVGSGG